MTADLHFPQPELASLADKCSLVTEPQLTEILSSHGLSILHINGRSLHRSFDDIVAFLSKLAFSVDFLLISETWLDPALVHGYKINGYQMIHAIPDSSFLGKGCAIYIKEDIFPYCKTLDDLCMKQLEYQSLFVHVKRPNSSFIVGTTYRSPSYPLDVFLPSLESTLCTLSQFNTSCFWGGDWNVNLFNYGESNETRIFLNCFSAYGFSPSITIPTRISNIPPYSSTLIDNIFCNVPSSVTYNGTVCTAIADHLAVFCVTNFTENYKREHKRPMAKTFDFRKGEELKQNVASKLTTYLDIDDPEQGAFILVSTIQEEMGKLSSRSSRRHTPVQPWITPSLVKCIERRNKLLKQFLKDKTPENEQRFRKYRNVLRLSLRHAKKIYYSKQFQKHAGNPRLLWNNLKEVSKISTQSSQLPSEFKLGNKQSSDPNIIAEEFNAYFSQVGPNLAQKLGHSSIDPLDYMRNIQVSETMSFDCVNESVICGIVSTLKETAGGLDDINVKVIKLLLPVISPILTHLINLCLSKCVFPSIFKQAVIVPIYKSGDRSLFSNYRPISLLPVLSKILETVMYIQLNDFCNVNNLFYQNQFGFRSGHSTYMPIALLHDFITSSIADGNKAAGIYLDLARAFDTVDISILLKKLTRYGIGEEAHDLLKSYLTERTHRLRYNDTVSGDCEVKCGVPQGSVLGPLLFLIYMNDIPWACNEANILLFADDTALLYKAPTLTELQNKVDRSFPKICQWLKANRLTLSVPKTLYQVYPASTSDDLEILVENSPLKRSSSVKYLGVIIDDQLKFKYHINSIVATCNRILGILHRAKFFLNKDLLLLLYNALILPHLTYCSVIWGSNFKTNLIPLVTMQKRAIRLITNSNYLAHTSSLFRELRLLKLHDIVAHQILLVLHDFLYDRLPLSLSSKLSLHEPSHSTRRKYHFSERISSSEGSYISNYRITKYRQHVLFCRGPVLWNSIITPKIPDLKNIPVSKTFFKKCLKIIFIDSY